MLLFNNVLKLLVACPLCGTARNYLARTRMARRHHPHRRRRQSHRRSWRPYGRAVLAVTNICVRERPARILGNNNNISSSRESTRITGQSIMTGRPLNRRRTWNISKQRYIPRWSATFPRARPSLWMHTRPLVKPRISVLRLGLTITGKYEIVVFIITTLIFLI